MALINIKKKIEKHADKLGIPEAVIAACTTNPSGTMKRMLSRELGGAVGSAFAANSGGIEDPEDGMAADFPDGQFLMALTETRLLLVKASVMTGAPKKIVAAWPRENVAAILIEAGRLAAPLQIAFTDGTAVQVEGAKGTDPGSVAVAFAASSRV